MDALTQMKIQKINLILDVNVIHLPVPGRNVTFLRIVADMTMRISMPMKCVALVEAVDMV